MKNFITFPVLLVTATFILSSCLEKPQETFVFKEYPYVMIQTHGTGMSSKTTYLDCDSFQFISPNSAFMWADGTKMKVVASEVILVRTKPKKN